MIKVFGSPHTRSLRITWMLEELGQAYQYVKLDFAKGDPQSPEYKAVNPAGKVPAIQDDDLTLTESGAIVTYLADKFSDQGLIPAAGTKSRARHDQWSYFACCELEQGLWTMGKNKFALPKERRCPEILQKAPWEFQLALGLFSEGLADNTFILGQDFSAADVLLGQTLQWGMAFKQPLEQDNLKAYADRVLSRPAVERAMAREAEG